MVIWSSGVRAPFPCRKGNAPPSAQAAARSRAGAKAVFAQDQLANRIPALRLVRRLHADQRRLLCRGRKMPIQTARTNAGNRIGPPGTLPSPTVEFRRICGKCPVASPGFSQKIRALLVQGAGLRPACRPVQQFHRMQPPAPCAAADLHHAAECSRPRSRPASAPSSV